MKSSDIEKRPSYPKMVGTTVPDYAFERSHREFSTVLRLSLLLTGCPCSRDLAGVSVIYSFLNLQVTAYLHHKGRATVKLQDSSKKIISFHSFSTLPITKAVTSMHFPHDSSSHLQKSFLPLLLPKAQSPSDHYFYLHLDRHNLLQGRMPVFQFFNRALRKHPSQNCEGELKTCT